jgi:hypothetical protein
MLYVSRTGAVQGLQRPYEYERRHVGRRDQEEEVAVTSPEAVRRAKSHQWRELDPETEQCAHCNLRLPKATDLEKVPGCTAVEICPDCFAPGKYEGRILINGRGYYQCPNKHRWQDANEKVKSPSKGYTIL